MNLSSTQKQSDNKLNNKHGNNDTILTQIMGRLVNEWMHVYIVSLSFISFSVLPWLTSKSDQRN